MAMSNSFIFNNQQSTWSVSLLTSGFGSRPHICNTLRIHQVNPNPLAGPSLDRGNSCNDYDRNDDDGNDDDGNDDAGNDDDGMDTLNCNHDDKKMTVLSPLPSSPLSLRSFEKSNSLNLILIIGKIMLMLKIVHTKW